MIMVSIRRQRLKAIRAGVPVEIANKADSVEVLVEFMQDLNKNSKEEKQEDKDNDASE